MTATTTTTTTTTEQANGQALDHLPADLLERLKAEIDLASIRICAEHDLDEHGSYTQGYLLLAGEKLGHFVRTWANGKPEGWAVRWYGPEDFTSAALVEGLGMSLLRLLRGEKLVAEFRFSLRHARQMARLHRQIERNAEGRADEPSSRGEGGEDKKVRCDKCQRVIPPWAETCPACMSRRKVLFRLLDFVKPYKTRAVGGAALALSITVLSLFQPALTRPMFNEGLGAKTGTPNWPLFLTYVGLMAGLFVLTAGGRGLQARLMAGLGSRVARNVRQTVYAHLHKLSLSFFSRKQTGGLVTRVTSDSDRLWDFVAFTVVELSISFLTIVGVGVFLFVMNWKLALFVLMPIPVMMGLMMFFHRRLHGIFGRIWHRWSQMTSVIADALPGVRVIKAFSQEGREIERFRRKNYQVFEEEMKMVDTWTTFGPAMQFLTELSVLLVYLLGGWWIVQNYQYKAQHGEFMPGGMDVGTLIAFISFMHMFYRPIHMIAHMDRMLNRAATSAQRIFEILDTEPTIFSRSGAHKVQRLDGGIELRNVSFSYDGVRRVLKDVSLTVAPGEMIGLAGPSGGGKTTLVNLICRFYDVLEGGILIDGLDVRDYDIDALRRRVGVVLQEPFLFHGTVAENIGYGRPEATLDEVIAAARAANAHEFIVGFTDGYDTLVGERGQSLSGGERQRISIARAILNNPTILILDEATSSVDTETEKLIQEALDRLISNRTTIAIAHRLSTLRKADRLVIMENGAIKEQGTHEELAGKPDGLYAKLLRMQMETQSAIAIA